MAIDEFKYFVYVLMSEKDKRLYTGYTNCLERRLKQHSEGLVKSTKNRRPLKLAYKEEFNDKKQAMEREDFFKSGRGRSQLKELMARYPSG